MASVAGFEGGVNEQCERLSPTFRRRRKCWLEFAVNLHFLESAHKR
jgi:hypothetical protein